MFLFPHIFSENISKEMERILSLEPLLSTFQKDVHYWPKSASRTIAMPSRAIARPFSSAIVARVKAYFYAHFVNHVDDDHW